MDLDGATMFDENGYGDGKHFDLNADLGVAGEDVSMDLEYGDDYNEPSKSDQENSTNEDFTKPSVPIKKYTKRIHSKRISFSFFEGDEEG